MHSIRKRLTFANVLSVIAVFIALGGAAVAATKIPKNSVGTKQLKKGAVTGEKVAKQTLTGANIQIGTLPQVPSAIKAETAVLATKATSADSAATADRAASAATADAAITAQKAQVADEATSAEFAHQADIANESKEADTLAGYEVGCPANTTLIRGLCFDDALHGPVAGVVLASNACTSAGGFLPDQMTLASIRTVVNLGSGTPPNFAVSSSYYFDDFDPLTITVDGTGTIRQLDAEGPGSETKYACMYPLVR